MDRVLQNLASTISVVFEIDGVPTAPSPNSATIKVIRADGTTVIAAGTPTTNGTTGEFKYTLTPTNCALLDELTAQWTATIGGTSETLETKIQIVGGFLFSLAEARLRPPLDSTTTWTASALAGLRTQVEEALEDACGGRAFVPRYALERHQIPRGCTLNLNGGPVRSVRSVNMDGQVFTAPQLAGIDLGDGAWVDYTGFVRRWGAPSLTIGYEYGMDYPPRPVKDAALELARASAGVIPGTIDPRTIRIDTQDGSLLLSRGSDAGSFGLPTVDRVVARYGLPLVGAA